jgi:hypothetical protein
VHGEEWACKEHRKEDARSMQFLMEFMVETLTCRTSEHREEDAIWDGVYGAILMEQ